MLHQHALKNYKINLAHHDCLGKMYKLMAIFFTNWQIQIKGQNNKFQTIQPLES